MTYKSEVLKTVKEAYTIAQAQSKVLNESLIIYQINYKGYQVADYNSCVSGYVYDVVRKGVDYGNF